MIPYTGEDLLQATFRAIIQEDERLRYALPLGFLRNGHGHLVNNAMAALRKTSNETFLSGVVERFQDELV